MRATLDHTWTKIFLIDYYFVQERARQDDGKFLSLYLTLNDTH